MKKSNSNCKRLILAGKAAAKRGDNAEAEKMFLQVLTSEPKHLDAHVNLGFMLLGARRERDAYSFFKAALMIDPDSTDALRGFEIAVPSEIKASGGPKKVFHDRIAIAGAKLQIDVANGDKAAIEADHLRCALGGV